MAKFHLDRLRDKYEGVKISGNVYSDIVQQIVESNSSNVQKKVYSMNADRWKDFDNKYRPSRETRMVLPPEEEVLPKRGVQVRKAAEQAAWNKPLPVVKKLAHKPASTSPVPPMDISGHPVLFIFNFVFWSLGFV